MSKKELIVPLFLFGCVAVLFSMLEYSFGQSPADCQAYAKRVQADYLQSSPGGSPRITIFLKPKFFGKISTAI